MGTPKIPTNLPTFHKKFITKAYAQWQGSWPVIFVSVMNEDGTPVKDLEIDNFIVGRIGNGSHWVEVPISHFDTQGRPHGFYWLRIQFDSGGLNWNFSPDSIFTAEAFKAELEQLHKNVYRGQCLAAMQTKTDTTP